MFDSLEYTKKLQEAGFTREQAEATVKLHMDVNGKILFTKADHIVFKDELSDTFRKIDKRFSEIEQRLARIEERLNKIENRLDGLETRLLIKLGGLMIVIQAAFITLAKFI